MSGNSQGHRFVHVRRDDEKRFPGIGWKRTDAMDTYARDMQSFADMSLIELQMKDGDILLSYRVLDTENLAQHFGIMTKTRRYADIVKSVSPSRECKDILTSFMNDSWSPDRALYKDIQLFMVVNYLTMDMTGGDMRTISVSIFRNDVKDASKKLEVNLSRAISLVARHRNIDPEVFREQVGITRYPAPVMLRAPAHVLTPDDRRIDLDIHPYTGLHPDQIVNLHADGCRAIISVENLTSFERLVREPGIEDLCIIYTAGNANTPVIDTISSIGDVPWFHWGDIDILGIRIPLSIAFRTGKPMRLVGHDMFLPEHMIDAKDDYERNATYLNGIFNDLATHEPHPHVLDILKGGYRTEQENIDPDRIVREVRKILDQ